MIVLTVLLSPLCHYIICYLMMYCACAIVYSVCRLEMKCLDERLLFCAVYGAIFVSFYLMYSGTSKRGHLWDLKKVS